MSENILKKYNDAIRTAYVISNVLLNELAEIKASINNSAVKDELEHLTAKVMELDKRLPPLL